MPLSRPVARQHMHTRTITCQGFHRDDGLWDIEGRITDVKTYSFPNHDRGGISAGEPLHDMVVRLTMDSERTVVHAEASTESAPFTICPGATASISQLEGLRIAPGWRKAVVKAMGGTHGCTHIRDLIIGPMATTAFQSIVPDNTAKGEVKDRRPPESLVDTCYAFDREGPVVKREFPDFYPGSGKS